MDLTVDHEAIGEVGARLTDAATTLPESVAVLGDGSGSPAVDQAIDRYATRLRDCALGAAAALYGLGRGPVDAARAFRETDQALAQGQA
jgi:hypothetical protein